MLLTALINSWKSTAYLATVPLKPSYTWTWWVLPQKSKHMMYCFYHEFSVKEELLCFWMWKFTPFATIVVYHHYTVSSSASQSAGFIIVHVLQSLTKRVGTTLQSCVQLVYCREIIFSQTVSPLPRFNVVPIMIIKPRLCAHNTFNMSFRLHTTLKWGRGGQLLNV